MRSGRYSRHELTNEQYHASEGISSSHLKCIHLKSLKHYKYEYLDKAKTFEQSEAMILGSYVHAGLLDSQSIDKEFLVEPDVDKRTKKGKAEYQEFLENLEGKTPIKAQAIETGKRMIEALHEHSTVKNILAGAVTEESIFKDDPFVGLIKCRADILNERLGFVGDLKIANSFAFSRFESEIRYLGYDLQAAFYLDCWGLDDFVIINIESEPPFDVVVYQLSESLIELGRNKYNIALDKLLNARKTGNWPGRAETIQLADLKRWEMKE